MGKIAGIGREVFRPTISKDMIIGTVEALQHYRSVYGLNAGATELLVKFERECVSIGYGTSKPAYVTTGVKRQSAINMESLGASIEEITRYNNSPEMDDATAAQMDWLIMHPEVDSSNPPPLKEFMIGGMYYAGTDSNITAESNVVSSIPERRNESRPQVVNDSALADALFNRL